MYDYDDVKSIVTDKWDYEVNENGLEVTEDRDIARIIIRIDKLVEKFDLNDVSFEVSSNQECSVGEKIYQKLNFGYTGGLSCKSKIVNQFFKEYLSIRDCRRGDFDSARAFSPNMTVYIQWMDDVEKSMETFDKMNSLSQIDSLGSYKVSYNDLENRIYKCFSDLGDKINGPGFKRIKSRIKKTCDKNYRSMLSYIDRLFENRSRLLVVRLDLKYKKDYNDARRKIISNSGFSSQEIDEFENVKSDMERLLANRRHNKIFDGLLGYIWKLEYGVLTRYHYHVMFFFNSSTKRADKLIGKSIGEYWSNEITQGRGTYFNVNASHNNYKFNVRGQIHYTDEDAREGLRHLAGYFSKADYFMRLKLPKRLRGHQKVNYRTMGKGQIQAPVPSKGGRPRKLSKQPSSCM
ncbi:inovirus-type Gp2 protein [uncultured Amphritea sp.]|uniref:YagK/YfjJ domain-containing protein n=1 Tax=uncultured Amphritea sp. TaxID=981605 RepID=UPI0026109495|nr:inovirus-type Gp2 protein [uncultured Amphritea sp.]